MLFLFYYMFHMPFQVCEQCPNVKYEREGYFVTVDIEKGMQDGQVSFLYFIVDIVFFVCDITVLYLSSSCFHVYAFILPKTESHIFVIVDMFHIMMFELTESVKSRVPLPFNLSRCFSTVVM